MHVPVSVGPGCTCYVVGLCCTKYRGFSMPRLLPPPPLHKGNRLGVGGKILFCLPSGSVVSLLAGLLGLKSNL